MRVIVYLALTALLGACVTQQRAVWQHRSGVSDQFQFNLDETACRGAVASARIPGPGGPPGQGGMAAGMQAGARDAQNASDRTAVFRGCMADRGWVLVAQ